MYRSLLVAAAGLSLMACSPEQAGEYSDESVNVEMIAPTPPSMDKAEAPLETAEAAADASAPSSDVSSDAMQPASTIAYSYAYELELPSDQVTPLQGRHEQACLQAGPQVCQMLGSDSRTYGEDQVVGTLRLRATPEWLRTFRGGLEGDADKAGGRIASSRTDAEDLARSLTDTEARLRALETLRDRLQQLLATRSGPLEQLLQTERELARVQGELDATRSTLAVLRQRVSMSELTLSYQSESRFASNSVFTPVARALGNSLRVFMATLGAMIYFIAGLLPVLLVLGPLGWLGLRWLRKRRDRKAADAS